MKEVKFIKMAVRGEIVKALDLHQSTPIQWGSSLRDWEVMFTEEPDGSGWYYWLFQRGRIRLCGKWELEIPQEV